MFWIFALGIVALAVYNTGFRKVLLWFVGLTGSGIILLSAAAAMTHGHI